MNYIDGNGSFPNTKCLLNSTCFSNVVSYLDRLAAVGVYLWWDFTANTCHQPEAYQKAHANGSCVLKGPAAHRHYICRPQTEAILATVSLLKNHPAILGWYTADGKNKRSC